MRRTMVVAELCSNVLPATPRRLREFCQAARHAGADAVKVQLFLASHFPESERQEKARVEFPRSHLEDFVGIAKDEGLLAGASVFDMTALADLAAAGGDFVKLASREQTNARLLDACRASGLTILRSVVWHENIRVLAHSGEITLGCIPEYPTSIEHPGLNRLEALPLVLPEPFGWSSHTMGWRDVIGAIEAGATVVEKHLKLSAADPEAGWSLYPGEFARMVEDIRSAEKRRLM